MPRLLILSMLTLLHGAAKSQNLVPNPSFELSNSCPSNNIFTAANWFNPNSASPDYFNPCGSGSTVPPNVLFGPQTAYTGTCFAGGGWYGLGGGFYDYMQVQLTSAMTAGTTYSVSMYVALAGGVMYGSDDVGIYISNGTFKSAVGNPAVTNSVIATTPPNFGVFNTFTPQIKPANGNYYTSTNWTLLGGTYTAAGGEDAITIGCFEDWLTTGTTTVNPLGNSRAYYFYDEVSVVAISAMTTAPTQPVAIAGATSACASSVQLFSVAPVAGATSYTWTLPNGWLGTSGTNTISVTTNTASGTLSVTASNTIGASPAQTLMVTVNNISATVTQTGSTLYSGPANTYTWVDCNNSNSPVATGSASFTPQLSGSYGVMISVNGCTATSACQSILVAPAQPGAISGATTLCNGAAQVYNILAVPNATSYTWVLPGGWNGTSTTNSILVTVNSASGTLSVTANNQAGPSLTQTLNISINNVSATVTQTGNTLYSSPGSTYQWIDCNNSFSVVASGSSSFTPSQSGSYAVLLSVNGCTALSACNSVFAAPAQPGSISGATVVCAGSAQVFSVLAVPNATSYSWTLPPGWNGTSTTNSIAVTVNSASGTLSVTANNQGGASAAQQLSITVNTVNAAITQTTNILYTGSASSYQWVDCSSNYSVVSTGSGSFAPAQSGNYAVIVSLNGCVDTSACVQVNVSTVGLAGLDTENSLIAFPNPADQRLFIKAAISNDVLTITVRDHVGRIIHHSEAKTAETIEIATELWAAGVYILELADKTKRLKTQKIVIAR